MTGPETLAAVFGVIAMFGAMFALVELRAADKDLVRAETWAEGQAEHEMLKHTFRLQLGLFISLGILALIAGLSFTRLFPVLFTPLMFGIDLVLTATAVLARVSRLRILRMMEDGR